jgi:hypothetical protein
MKSARQPFPAKDADIARRRGAFEAALKKMKQLAER